jgi:hypothetical protein
MAGEQTNNRMPGFTAQDSLYKTGGRYQTAAKWSGSTQGQAVIPQLTCNGCSPTSGGNKWWCEECYPS